MEFEEKCCPITDIDGHIATGKQFDLDITLPHDNRDVIYGIIKNCFKEPVADAVVKLVEIEHKMGKEERKPVSHTFTDKNGEFVFGPLCPGKEYSIQIWVDDVKHFKVCAKSFHEGKCLKGIKLDNTIDNPEILLTAAWLGIKKKNTAAAMMATASVKIINSFNSSCFFIIIIESFFRILQSNHYITEYI